MQIVKLAVPVPTIGPAVDVHVRLGTTPFRAQGAYRGLVSLKSVSWCAAYDRQAGAWHFPKSPEAIAELLAAAGVVLR